MEGDSGPTWERRRGGIKESSRIDFVISRGNSEWSPIRSTKLLSDHWVIYGNWEIDIARKVKERTAVDWKKLDKIVDDLKEKDLEEEEEKWYRGLRGSSPNEKLKSLKNLCDKKIKVCKRSKRWWDEELSDQLKKRRRMRKGREGEGINQEGTVRRWKAEKEKIRSMLQESCIRIYKLVVVEANCDRIYKSR